jgi:hypothetical protein
VPCARQAWVEGFIERIRWAAAIAAASSLLAASAASAQTLRVDLNRDGLADRVAVAQAPSGRLIVALSGRPDLIVLATRSPILRVAAADLDGDGDVDLVALGRDLQVRRWLNAGTLGTFVKERCPIGSPPSSGHFRPLRAFAWSPAPTFASTADPIALLPATGCSPTAHGHWQPASRGTCRLASASATLEPSRAPPTL